MRLPSTLRRGIALTAGFIVLAAVPVTIGALRADDQADADGGGGSRAATTVYTSYVSGQ